MVKLVNRIADRMLAGLVSNTVAGACACGGSYCTNQTCHKGHDVYEYRNHVDCWCNLVYQTCDCP